jgi:hypothetical protein
MAEEKFFVGINNHLDVRRNVLECSREMIQSLQSYEKITRVREVKIQRIKQLRTVIKEIDLLMAKLQDQLPKTNLRAAVVQPSQELKIRTRTKDVSDIDKLEEQLRDIESEIAKLS